MFEKDVGHAMITDCDYTDGMYLVKAAKIMQKEMRQQQKRFNGTFHDKNHSELPFSSSIDDSTRSRYCVSN